MICDDCDSFDVLIVLLDQRPIILRYTKKATCVDAIKTCYT